MDLCCSSFSGTATLPAKAWRSSHAPMPSPYRATSVLREVGGARRFAPLPQLFQPPRPLPAPSRAMSGRRSGARSTGAQGGPRNLRRSGAARAATSGTRSGARATMAQVCCAVLRCGRTGLCCAWGSDIWHEKWGESYGQGAACPSVRLLASELHPPPPLSHGTSPQPHPTSHLPSPLTPTARLRRLREVDWHVC